MPNLNQVTLVGHVGKTPELKQFGSSQKLTFSLATSYSYRDKLTNEFKKITTWHNIVLWGETALYCKGIEKGELVYVYGRIDNRSFDGKDGKKIYVNEVVAEKCYSLSDKKKTERTKYKTEQTEMPLGQSAMAQEYKVSTGPEYTTNDIPF